MCACNALVSISNESTVSQVQYCIIEQMIRRARLTSRAALAANARHFSNPLQRNISTVTSDEIALDRHPNGVYTLFFNNEKKLNPMTVAMGEAFEEAIAQLSDDKDLRCLILTGKGKAFSAGGDLKFLRDRTADTPHNNTKIMRAFYRRFLSLRSLQVPVISALNGPAIGAGFCVAVSVVNLVYSRDELQSNTF